MKLSKIFKKLLYIKENNILKIRLWNVKKIFTSDRGLIFRIYGDFTGLYNKKENDQINNCAE